MVNETITDKSVDNKKPLPKGWKWVKLGDVCKVTMGQSPPGTSYNRERKGSPLLNGPTEFGKFHPTPIQWTTQPVRFAEKGEILLCVRGATTGKKNIADQRYCIGRGLAAISGIQEKTDTQFLIFLLDTITENLLKETSGSTFPNLSGEKLESFEIPLPPLAEQKRIAAILSEQLAAVERARKAAQEQLEAAKALPAAYLREVFESEEAKRWEKEKLAKHVTKIGSGITPLGGYSSYLSTGIPLIRSQNIHINKFTTNGLAYISKEQDKLMENSRVQPRDVLLNITGASIGRVCVVPTEICPANVNQHVSIIRVTKTLSPLFLAHYLSTPKFQKFIMNSQSGATRQALTKSMIENFIIPIPPIKEQEKIIKTLSEKVSQAKKVQELIEVNFGNIVKLPSALLQRAFSGEL